VERQAGHGEQIVDAGVRRRWRQVGRAQPGTRIHAVLTFEHLDAQSELDPIT